MVKIWQKQLSTAYVPLHHRKNVVVFVGNAWYRHAQFYLHRADLTCHFINLMSFHMLWITGLIIKSLQWFSSVLRSWVSWGWQNIVLVVFSFSNSMPKYFALAFQREELNETIEAKGALNKTIFGKQLDHSATACHFWSLRCLRITLLSSPTNFHLTPKHLALLCCRLLKLLVGMLPSKMWVNITGLGVDAH